MANSDNDNPRIISLGQIEIDPGKFDARPDTEALPLLPTRNLVLFPTVATPLSLVREQSLRVAREAFEKSVPLGVVCQLDPDNENPGLDGLQPFGVVADVLKIFDLPDGQHTALIRARDKFQIVGESESVSPGNTLIARVELIKEQKPRSNDKTFGAIATAVKDMTLKMLESIDGAQDFAHNVQNYPEPVGLINLICSQAPISSEKKAALLAENSVKERARMLLLELTEFERMQQVTQKIQSIARENFEQNAL